MSTSPLPPDPYEALGVSKDCDVDAIKKAHRKLVLKHHPDRIKDPALVEQGKNEFQKVQQAYELLTDPARRQRYDDETRLAQLRRERMMSEPPRPTYTKTTYTARPSPAPTHPVQREYKAEPRYSYEERVPDSPYENTPRGFEDLPPRATARKVDPKVDPYERKSSTAKVPERKDKPKASGWEKPAAGMSMRMAFGMKNVAHNAKTKLKEKEKELHAKNAKLRDKEERMAREQKNTYTRPSASYVEDYSESESSETDSDTVVGPNRTPARARSPAPKPRGSLTPESRPKRQPSPASRVFRQSSPQPGPKAPRQPSPQPKSKSSRLPSPQPNSRNSKQTSPRPSARSYFDDNDSHDEDKYERQIRNAQGYQYSAREKEQRPSLSRQNSDMREHLQPESVRDKKSGSDSDKQRSANPLKAHRRSMPDDSKPRPSLATQSSAPSGVRAAANVVDRDPLSKPRSRQNSYVSSTHRQRDVPELRRSESAPMPPKAPAKRDSVPIKGSSLKTETNHDSGYVSSSNPQTPENGGGSPPRESRPREVSTKYRVGKDEDVLRARKMTEPSQFLSPPEHNHHGHHTHHYRTESRERRSSRSRSRSRSRDRDRERESDGHHRPSPSRPGYGERRPSFSRNESSSRYEEKSRGIRLERSPDRSYFRQWDAPVPIRQSRPKAPTYSSTNSPNFAKYVDEPSSANFARSTTQRRPSVY